MGEGDTYRDGLLIQGRTGGIVRKWTIEIEEILKSQKMQWRLANLLPSHSKLKLRAAAHS